MTELLKQVHRAQRRINFQRFLGACIWSLALCFGVAAVALGMPKLRHIPIAPQQWTSTWLIGSAVAGLVSAAIWTWWTRRSELDAAIELDRQFGLRERVSSSLALTSEEAETDVGRALIDDAIRRISRIDVSQKFPVRTNRWAWLPLLSAAIAFGLVFVPNAQQQGAGQAQATSIEAKKQVKKTATELKKKLANKSKELEEKGLKDASKLVKEVERGMEDMAKKGDADRKEALVKMQDLAKALKARRDDLQGADDLKKQLNQIKDIKLTDGPANELAKAMQNGDFQKALDQLGNLQQKLQGGELTPEQQQKLAEQMKQMQNKLANLAQAHEDAKKNLEQQMNEKLKQGDKAGAEKLRQQLQRLQAQDPQKQKMQQMADKMQKMAQAMDKGDQQEAARQLAEMAGELKELQAQADEMQALDEALEQMGDARDAMNCKKCQGEGCALCQGMGDFGQSEMEAGMGMGEGRGKGDRPEEETDTNFYDSKVTQNPGSRMVVTGNVRGPNKPGEAREAIKEAMEAAATSDENPLTNVRLPRAQREQAQQYFDAVREKK